MATHQPVQQVFQHEKQVYCQQGQCSLPDELLHTFSMTMPPVLFLRVGVSIIFRTLFLLVSMESPGLPGGEGEGRRSHDIR